MFNRGKKPVLHISNSRILRKMRRRNNMRNTAQGNNEKRKNTFQLTPPVLHAPDTLLNSMTTEVCGTTPQLQTPLTLLNQPVKTEITDQLSVNTTGNNPNPNSMHDTQKDQPLKSGSQIKLEKSGPFPDLIMYFGPKKTERTSKGLLKMLKSVFKEFGYGLLSTWVDSNGKISKISVIRNYEDNKEILAEGEGENLCEAENEAVSILLKKLRTTNYVIEAKSSYFTNGKIPACICNVDPSLSHIYKVVCLRRKGTCFPHALAGAVEYVDSYEDLWKFIEDHGRSGSKADLFILNIEKSDRSSIKTICQKTDMVVENMTGCSDRGVVARRKENKNEILQDLLKCGGDTIKYRVLPPGSEIQDDIDLEAAKVGNLRNQQKEIVISQWIADHLIIMDVVNELSQVETAREILFCSVRDCPSLDQFTIERKTDLKTRVVTVEAFIDRKIVGRALGFDDRFVKTDAAKNALARLQELCYYIKAKPSYFGTDGHFPEFFSGEHSQDQNSFFKVVHYEEVKNEHELYVLLNWFSKAKNTKLEDLFFLQDFTLDERQIVINIAQRLYLSVRQFGQNNVCVYKKRKPKDVFKDLMSTKSKENLKYKLIIPPAKFNQQMAATTKDNNEQNIENLFDFENTDATQVPNQRTVQAQNEPVMSYRRIPSSKESFERQQNSQEIVGLESKYVKIEEPLWQKQNIKQNLRPENNEQIVNNRFHSDLSYDKPCSKNAQIHQEKSERGKERNPNTINPVDMDTDVRESFQRHYQKSTVDNKRGFSQDPDILRENLHDSRELGDKSSSQRMEQLWKKYNEPGDQGQMNRRDIKPAVSKLLCRETNSRENNQQMEQSQILNRASYEKDVQNCETSNQETFRFFDREQQKDKNIKIYDYNHTPRRWTEDVDTSTSLDRESNNRKSIVQVKTYRSENWRENESYSYDEYNDPIKDKETNQQERMHDQMEKQWNKRGEEFCNYEPESQRKNIPNTSAHFDQGIENREVYQHSEVRWRRNEEKLYNQGSCKEQDSDTFSHHHRLIIDREIKQETEVSQGIERQSYCRPESWREYETKTSTKYSQEMGSRSIKQEMKASWNSNQSYDLRNDSEKGIESNLRDTRLQYDQDWNKSCSKRSFDKGPGIRTSYETYDNFGKTVKREMDSNQHTKNLWSNDVKRLFDQRALYERERQSNYSSYLCEATTQPTNRHLSHHVPVPIERAQAHLERSQAHFTSHFDEVASQGPDNRSQLASVDYQHMKRGYSFRN